MDKRKFQTGSGQYKCLDCGKQTRDTGHGEGDARLCRACYEAAETANAESDDGEDTQP